MAAQQPGPTARQRLKHERPSPRTRVSRWSLFEDKGTTWIDAVHRPGLAWYPPEVFLRGEPNFVARCQLLQVFIDVVEVLYICANEIFEPGVAVETSPAATNLDDRKSWPILELLVCGISPQVPRQSRYRGSCTFVLLLMVLTRIHPPEPGFFLSAISVAQPIRRPWRAGTDA